MAAVMSLVVLPVSAVMSASAAGSGGWAGSSGWAGSGRGGGRGAAIAVVPVRAYPVAFIGPVSVTVPMVMGGAVFIAGAVPISPWTRPVRAKGKAAACSHQYGSGYRCCYYSPDFHDFQSPS